MLHCGETAHFDSPNFQFQIWKEESDSGTDSTYLPHWLLYDESEALLLGGCISDSIDFTFQLDDGLYFLRPSHPDSTNWLVCGLAIDSISEISFRLDDGACLLLHLLFDHSEYPEASPFSITFKGVAVPIPGLTKDLTENYLTDLILSHLPDASIRISSFQPFRFEFLVQTLLDVPNTEQQRATRVSMSPIYALQSKLLEFLSKNFYDNQRDRLIEVELISILPSLARRSLLQVIYDGKWNECRLALILVCL
jgi:hypothetical protein